MNRSLKNEKILTIITVVKNDKENIKNTINSVLSQKIKNFEYIIFDGNSTDGTSEIISKIKSKKIRYFRRNDLSLYDAMNKSIYLSKGKYIGILHSGDIFIKKNHLKNVLKILEKKPDILSGNVAFYEKYKKKIFTNRIWRYPISKLNLFSAFKIPHTSMYIKKNLLKKINFYNVNYKIASDLDLLMKIIKIEKLNFIYFDNYFILMKNKGLSTSYNYFFLKIKEDLKILFKNFSLFFFIIYFYKIIIKIPSFFQISRKVFKLN